MSENIFIKVLMGTSEKIQFKMMLPNELVERLDLLAKKSGKRSGQEVVMELIDVYLPVWINVNDSMNRAVQYQTKIVAEKTVNKNKKGRPKLEVETGKLEKEEEIKKAS